MSAEGGRSIELQVVNTTAEEFVIYSAMLPESGCQWISGEQAKVGVTLKVGGSTTWGVISSSTSITAIAEVRLKGGKGSNIGFEFKNLPDGLSLVEVELSTDIYYDVQPAAIGVQSSCKVIITSLG